MSSRGKGCIKKEVSKLAAIVEKYLSVLPTVGIMIDKLEHSGVILSLVINAVLTKPICQNFGKT